MPTHDHHVCVIRVCLTFYYCSIYVTDVRHEQSESLVEVHVARVYDVNGEGHYTRLFFQQ